jgi:tetratricopeptide (TPR) repeat protein
MTRISLCMIVRDEEQLLERCLASAAGAVDEICVVDTGSTDRTTEIAERHGARVQRTKWRDDFSAARNLSIAMAGADWILVLDADEELLDDGDGTASRARLQQFAEQRADSVGRVALENRNADGDTSVVALTRFFPNDDRHAFRGRVHEQLVASDGERDRDPLREDTGVRVFHRGYDLEGVAREAKLARNEALLRRALEDAPDDGYLWFQLGRTRALAEDHTAALAALEQALARCPDDAPWAATVLETGAYSLRALDRSQQALALLEQVEDSFAQRPDTCFLIALLAMDCGQLERAGRGFERCLTLVPGGAGDPGAAESSTAASTYAPAFNLGVMHEVQGRPHEAADWYRRALAFRPDHGPSLDGLRRLGA